MESYLDLLKKVESEKPSPVVELQYKDVTCTVDIPLTDNRLPNALRAVVTGAAKLVPGYQTPSTRLTILHQVSGVIRPGTSTVILSNKGGAKSTFLRMLAGRDPNPTTKNVVQYNGQTPDTLNGQLRKLCYYLPQDDEHEPLLTVDETAQFCYDNGAIDPSAVTPDATDNQKKEYRQRIDSLVKILDLDGCRSTYVGGNQLKGISGGQKKRVSILEALITNARGQFFDEYTNGLDAVTAYNITKYLVEWAKITQGTFVAALQAPTPETFHLFDDVILLSDGHIVYHGPVNQVEVYIKHLGFIRPHYQDLADFLVTLLTSPLLSKRTQDEDPDLKVIRPPVSVEIPTLAQIWRESAAARALFGTTDSGARSSTSTNSAIVVKPGQRSDSTHVAYDSTLIAQLPNVNLHHATAQLRKNGIEYGNNAVAQYLFQREYTHSFFDHLKLSFARQSKLIRRNPVLVIAKLNQAIAMGLIIGSLFVRSRDDKTLFVLKLGLALFATIFVSFGNMAESPVVAYSKKIVYRHTNSALFPETSYIASVLLNHLPFTLLANLFFSSLLYFLGGFTESDSLRHYGFFYFTLLSHELALASMFRMFGYLARSVELAQALAGAATGVFLVMGGFLIPYGRIPKFVWPLFYISPFSWSLRSLAINEFESSDYTAPIYPNGPSSGQIYMAAFDFTGKDVDFFTEGFKWAGPGVLLIYWFLFGYVFSVLVIKNVRYDVVPGTKRNANNYHILLTENGTTTEGKGTDATNNNTSRKGAVTIRMPAAITDSALPTDSTPTPIASTTTPTTPGDSEAEPITDLPINLSRTPSHKSALPITPATLAFKNITYEVYNPRNKKTLQLLKGIDGVCKPFELTALVGASGAGKTTLLDVLAFRKTMGKVGGSICINGKPVSAAEFSKISAYVEQEPLYLDTATVYETLHFTASLRLDPTKVTDAQKTQHIADIIEMLELQPLKNRIVSSLAPGEMKLLSVAAELCVNPSILFLDEPVTGLDARSATLVISALKRVASTGRTIICTIHQPSVYTFLSFDNLILLSAARQAYFGPIGKNAHDLINHFQSIPHVSKISEGINPATWILEVLQPDDEEGDKRSPSIAVKPAPSGNATSSTSTSSPDNTTPSGLELTAIPTMAKGTSVTPQRTLTVDDLATVRETADRAVIFADYYKQSAVYAKVKADIDTSVAPTTDGIITTTRAGSPAYIVPFLTQLNLLTARGFRGLWRDPSYTTLRALNIAFLSLLFGCVYYQITANDQAGTLGKIAVILGNAGFCGILCFTLGLPKYFRERPVYYRERSAGLYAPEAYSVSIAIIEIPHVFFVALLFQSLNHFMVGFQPNASVFFTMVLGVFLVAYYYASVASFFVPFFPNGQVAQIVGGVFISLTMLFAGVFISVVDMPAGWKSFYYCIGNAWIVRLLGVTEFYCDSTQGTCPQIPVVINGQPTVMDRYAFVRDFRLDFSYDDRWSAIGYVLLLIAIFRLLSMIGYRFINHQKR